MASPIIRSTLLLGAIDSLHLLVFHLNVREVVVVVVVALVVVVTVGEPGRGKIRRRSGGCLL